MSIVDYCVLVQRAVKNSKPTECSNEDFSDWFSDTGGASIALGYALEGRDGKALNIAEKLAEKYALEFSKL
tara:strand:- start:130 stop:342 length:213 start_codon:yes stop_codon:yes gene_type:complete